MQIRSASFIKGLVADDPVLHDGTPQIAFIGRSNVGKSSTINALTKRKNLARTSAFPGRTQEINIFLINKTFYLVDLPGYGFAKASKTTHKRLQTLIDWYLFSPDFVPTKVILLIDANIGVTDSDQEILQALEVYQRTIIIGANKIDKIKRTEYDTKLTAIIEAASGHHVIPYSTKKGFGIDLLAKEILKCSGYLT